MASSSLSNKEHADSLWEEHRIF